MCKKLKKKNNVGTFTMNKYSTQFYEAHGIKVVAHFFDKDEFYLPCCDYSCEEDKANEYIEYHYPEDCKQYWKDHDRGHPAFPCLTFGKKKKFGTFTDNTFSTKFYEAHDIVVDAHFFDKDEFWLPGYTHSVYMEEADMWLWRNYRQDCEKYFDEHYKYRTHIVKSNGKKLGTFTRNTYSTDFYAGHGIVVRTHFFARDEFILPDGRNVYMEEADKWLEEKYPEDCQAYKIQ